MDTNPVLTTQPAQLVAPFQPPDTMAGVGGHREHDQLTHAVSSVTDSALLAVRSVLGVAVTLTRNGQQVTLTSMTADVVASDIASSLQVPLVALAAHLDGQVVFYAATPGAFVDFAADLQCALGLNDTEVRLDEDLSPTHSSGVTGAEELSVVNRAIGFLMDRGHTPETAQHHLAQHAATTGLSLHRAAEDMLTTRTGD